MNELKKPKTIIARVSEAQFDKLSKILKERNITVSQWIRDRIEHSKEVKQ